MVNWLIINISFTVSRSGDCLQHVCTTQLCHRLGFITLSIYISYIHTHQDWKQVKAVYLKSWAKWDFSISFQSKILILILILILVARSEDTSSDLRLIFFNCMPWGSHAVGQLLLLKCCGSSIWISWFYCRLFFCLNMCYPCLLPTCLSVMEIWDYYHSTVGWEMQYSILIL